MTALAFLLGTLTAYVLMRVRPEERRWRRERRNRVLFAKSFDRAKRR